MRKTLTILTVAACVAFGFPVFADSVDEEVLPQQSQAELQEVERGLGEAIDEAPVASELAVTSVEAPSCEQGAEVDFGLAVAFLAPQASAGEQCGGAICGKFQYCCNPSCSICVFYGMSCTQQSCN